jgi:nicotinate-nucleotide adenylyltransferase
MRVGVLGGTFDPVHNGHLVLAAAARDHFRLDLVLFVPAGDPWRKTRTILSAHHRLGMLRLAIARDESLGISDVELRRDGPSYTADTLESLAGERLDDQFWFIVGADALEDMPNWKDPARIVSHAIIAVAPRGDVDINEAYRKVPELAGRVETFPMAPVETSSTEIRERVARGQDVQALVPDAVAEYIRMNRLYLDPSES